MFGSAILDVTIGLLFLYLLLSLLCSAVGELIEAWLKRRATDLERGLRELLADPDGTALVKKLYDHPLIYGLYRGNYEPAARRAARRWFRPVLPSYIPSRTFALALLDVVSPAVPASGGGSPAEPRKTLREAVGAIENASVKRALTALIDAAGDDVTKTRENIERWYDQTMDRVAGWYKRRTQLLLLGLGFVVAVVINADTIALGKSLAYDEALRTALITLTEDYLQPPQALNCDEPANASQCGQQERQLGEDIGRLQQLGLPLGWDLNDQRAFPGDELDAWALKVAGWLLTAVAVSLGAPFWFDLLNKIMIVRSTVKPHEKSPEEPSIDR